MLQVITASFFSLFDRMHLRSPAATVQEDGCRIGKWKLIACSILVHINHFNLQACTLTSKAFGMKRKPARRNMNSTSSFLGCIAHHMHAYNYTMISPLNHCRCTIDFSLYALLTLINAMTYSMGWKFATRYFSSNNLQAGL